MLSAANRRERLIRHPSTLFPLKESQKELPRLLKRYKSSSKIGTNNCLTGQTKYLPTSMGL